jgi:hypothetical protein
MRAQYLGRSGDNEQFSLRPLAGTAVVPIVNIQGCFASAREEPILPTKPQKPYVEVVGE